MRKTQSSSLQCLVESSKLLKLRNAFHVFQPRDPLLNPKFSCRLDIVKFHPTLIQSPSLNNNRALEHLTVCFLVNSRPTVRAEVDCESHAAFVRGGKVFDKRGAGCDFESRGGDYEVGGVGAAGDLVAGIAVACCL
jgi:hypothetical protein